MSILFITTDPIFYLFYDRVTHFSFIHCVGLQTTDTAAGCSERCQIAFWKPSPNPFSPQRSYLGMTTHFRHDPLSRKLPPRGSQFLQTQRHSFSVKKASSCHTPKCAWVKQNRFNHLEIWPKLVTPFIYHTKKGKKHTHTHTIPQYICSKPRKDCMSRWAQSKRADPIIAKCSQPTSSTFSIYIYIYIFSLQSAG